MQGPLGAYVALEGREKYIHMEKTDKDTVILSSESGEILIDSIEGFFRVRHAKAFEEGDFIRFKIKLLY